MNVVAKSTSLAPLLKSTTVISNGLQPVIGTGVVLKPKIVTTKPAISRQVSESLQETLITGSLRVCSGIGGSKLVLNYYILLYFMHEQILFSL